MSSDNNRLLAKLAHLYQHDWYARHQAWLAEQGYQHHPTLGAEPRRLSSADQYLALRNADLRLANLERADLSGVRIEQTNLQQARLAHVSLEDARIKHTDLAGASLAGAKMTEALLVSVNLTRANLADANLDQSTLVGVQLKRSTITRCIGDGRVIKSMQIDYTKIALAGNSLAIGCEQHAVSWWLSLTVDDIENLFSEYIEWAERWRPLLLQLLRCEGFDTSRSEQW